MKYLIRDMNTNVIVLVYEMIVQVAPPLEIVEVSDTQYRGNMLGSIFTDVNLYKPVPSLNQSEFDEWWESDGTNWADVRPDQQIWDDVRKNRINELLYSDWTQLDDSPLTPPEKAEWNQYRQKLRDVPNNNPGNPRGADDEFRNVRDQDKPVTARGV